jgi:hypothetical protein
MGEVYIHAMPVGSSGVSVVWRRRIDKSDSRPVWNMVSRDETRDESGLKYKRKPVVGIIKATYSQRELKDENFVRSFF